jgi:hypothetical protein
VIDPVFQSYDYAIGGKMVVGRATMSDHYRMLLEDGDDDARKNIKRELIMQMADYMLQNNLVEFTYQDNPMDMSRTIAVRAYLAPNDQVKILRLANKVV